RRGDDDQMVAFELYEDQRVLQASVREMCERLSVPDARRWDQEERFPHEIVPPLGEMGLLGMQIPEAYGGAGMKFHDYVIALGEVARADASIGLTMASHNSLCTGHIYLAANEAQKQKYLPRLASGKALGAWGLTERGTHGFRTGKRIEKMGLHASDTTELVLEEVEVGDEQRLGEIDQGFFDTLKILDKGRIGIGAWSIGIGRAAFEAARRYAKE